MTSDAIQLPDAPDIHGLRFRHFRGRDDFNHMAGITRTSAEADDTERADTPEAAFELLKGHLTTHHLEVPETERQQPPSISKTRR
jgi:hypothetical protein